MIFRKISIFSRNKVTWHVKILMQMSGDGCLVERNKQLLSVDADRNKLYVNNDESVISVITLCKNVDIVITFALWIVHVYVLYVMQLPLYARYHMFCFSLNPIRFDITVTIFLIEEVGFRSHFLFCRMKGKSPDGARYVTTRRYVTICYKA